MSKIKKKLMKYYFRATPVLSHTVITTVYTITNTHACIPRKDGERGRVKERERETDSYRV
jgi:hypothetical protein